ncbi:MAG TPA: CBS domain-containing protein [Candidatus Thermoplasmatota archaeon]|nr:CBS domain-containing protein [Candidatus Thermoplasmatota archaeon]
MIDHLVETDFKAVDKRDGVAAATGYLLGDTDRVPIVTDHERPWGVLNERGFMRTRVHPYERVENYTLGTGALTTDLTLEETVRRMAAASVDHFPVEERGRLIGYVSALRVLEELEVDLPAHRLLDEVPHLREDQSAGDAIHFFHDTKVAVLPVVDASGHLAAVLHRRDIVPIGLNNDRGLGGRTYAGGERNHFSDIEVKGLMETSYGTVRPNDAFDHVVEVLKQFRAAVVVDEQDRPLGVITPTGAVKRIAPELS